MSSIGTSTWRDLDGHWKQREPGTEVDRRIRCTTDSFFKGMSNYQALGAGSDWSHSSARCGDLRACTQTRTRPRVPSPEATGLLFGRVDPPNRTEVVPVHEDVIGCSGGGFSGRRRNEQRHGGWVGSSWGVVPKCHSPLERKI